MEKHERTSDQARKSKMKKKLLALGLPENVVSDILDVYDTYQQSIAAYSKPAGVKEFSNNIQAIKKLSEGLSEKLKNATGFERSMLCYPLNIDVRKLKMDIDRLSMACDESQKRNVKSAFSRKEPFVRQLAIEIKEVLEKHDIPVKVYTNNVFCSILDVLLNQKAGDRSFNLLREVCKKHS